MNESPTALPDLSFLQGAICTKIDLLDPEQWRFYFGDHIFLDVICLWRIISNNRIDLTSLDHGQKFGLPKPVDARELLKDFLQNQEVITFNLREITSDIVIKFNNNVILEILTNSAGYESWLLHHHNGGLIIAMGGGELAIWSPN